MGIVSVTYNALWNAPTISNKDILSIWGGDNHPTALEYKTSYLSQDPEYNPPREQDMVVPIPHGYGHLKS